MRLRHPQRLDSIVRVNDDFRFGSDYSFPAAAPIAYRSKQGHLFTLETLIHFLKHSHLKYTDYMKNIKPLAVPTVSFIDRKPLLDYLLGHVSSSDAVQYVNPNFSPAPAAEYHPEDPGLDPALDTNEDVSRVGLSENYIEMIRAAERLVRDREAILECKNKDFYEVLKAAARREEERQRSDSQQRKDGLVAKNRLMRGDEELGLGYDSTPRAKMRVKGGKAGEGVPIILVPSALQTLITIYNVKEFLEDGVFIPTDAKMKQVKVAKPDCVTVQKKFSRDRVVTAYKVRDKPSGAEGRGLG
ncbi:hypothetical protein RHMOL_Rhmol04G0328000 [Rhododendron molle]|uniref:Uncharacterized protein n=1 Tax=Rhododendron molle TaxID=49168 RepID=A0ACC0P7W8_RHOML|nr:hypothetical protein RHMOL_Rhmol04G0328000 [Rhododendron molle]